MNEKNVGDIQVSAAKFAGYQKACPAMGDRVDSLRAMYALPNIGDLIVIREMDVTVIVTNSPSPVGTHTNLVPNRHYLTEDGKDMIFKVKDYSISRDAAIDRRNNLILERVYPILGGRLDEYRIPCRWISTGSTICQTVELGENGDYVVVDKGRRMIVREEYAV